MALILIAEDNISTAEEIAKRFRAAGHQCSVQRSGTDVVETARQAPPDAILLDVMLPGTSGFEVCRRIRRDPELYTTPVLMISAMNDEEEVFHGLAQGADDYVVKPFDPTQVLQRIEALLRASSGRHETDPLTGLPGLDGTRREIQRRSSMRESFALAHCELPSLRDVGRKHGLELRDKAIRHLARALTGCGQEVCGDKCFVGHMGGGHFIALVSPDRAKLFCESVTQLWTKHAAKLDAGLPKAGPKDSQPALADILFCITIRERMDTTTPQQIFEILSQIRHKALHNKRGGIHMDRRQHRPQTQTGVSLQSGPM